MARSHWCSYKRTTVVVCSINIFVAIYVLHSYTSAYMYTRKGILRIKLGKWKNRIRKQLEPVQLIELLKGLKEEFLVDEKVVQVPRQIKQKIADEILAALKGVNATVQRGDYAFI
ncbi:hypothetical protein RND71_038326 [Anisodus tanguticus]|uniref:Uncharacterized protein n=1 Tax=Anisodus tanguticus TaxID=243964 RepID=A0AAE1QZH3_9SOLA|nr:hypothetical protein RND71_038326 [Anisodus tanguticus]